MNLDIVFLADGPAGPGWYWKSDEDGVLHGPWPSAEHAAMNAERILTGEA